jgi:hypothetical protein
MFKQSVNGACINDPLRCSTLGGMHPSMERLLNYARRSTAGLPLASRLVDFQALQARLGVSSAVMTNWKARGISKEGALQAQEALGCSATWLLSGDGPDTSDDWPFTRVARARWLACTAEDRGYVQAAMNKALEECEVARAASSGKPQLAARA